MAKTIRSHDDQLKDALQRLRHASFALSAAASSQIQADRDLAEAYLIEMAREFVRRESQRGGGDVRL